MASVRKRVPRRGPGSADRAANKRGDIRGKALRSLAVRLAKRAGGTITQAANWLRSNSGYGPGKRMTYTGPKGSITLKVTGSGRVTGDTPPKGAAVPVLRP